LIVQIGELKLLDNSYLIARLATNEVKTFSVAMLTWKFFAFLSVLPILTHCALNAPQVHPFASLKMVKCKAAEGVAFPNISCFAKSYSRNTSTMNIYIAFRKPLNELFVSLNQCATDETRFVFRPKEFCCTSTEQSTERL
jgi:hypothetical protein